MFAFRSESGALKAVVGLLKARLNPSILEFLDRQSVGCAERYTGKTMLLIYEEFYFTHRARRPRSEVREQKNFFYYWRVERLGICCT